LGILKADVNLQLLFLILVVVVLLVSFNIHYQNKISSLSSLYEKKIQELESLSEKLKLEQNNSIRISKLKEMAQEDKIILERSYFNFINENEYLKEENQQLQNKLEFEPAPIKVFQKTLCKTTGNVKCLQ